MNKEQVEGSLDKASGKIKEAIGHATNSPTTVAKGQAEQVKGEVKKQAGNVKEAVNDQVRNSGTN